MFMSLKDIASVNKQRNKRSIAVLSKLYRCSPQRMRKLLESGAIPELSDYMLEDLETVVRKMKDVEPELQSMPRVESKLYRFKGETAIRIFRLVISG